MNRSSQNMDCVEEVKLLYDVPDIVVSIQIPYNEHTNTISFSKILKKITKNSLNSTALKNSAVCDNLLVGHKRANSYDNFIERLERKYRSEAIFVASAADADSDDHSQARIGEDDDDDGPRDGDEANDTVTGGRPLTIKAKKKKLAAGNDGYDYDDPLLDDSVCVSQVQAQLQSQRTRTRYGGFYVSYGVLEVDAAPHRDKEKDRKKQKQLRQASDNDSSQQLHSQSAKTQLKAPISNQNTAKEVLPSKVLSTGPQPHLQVPNELPKRAWTPAPEVMRAFDTFRNAVAASGLRATKSCFPAALEPALSALHQAVPVKSADMLTAVCEAVGGAFSTGRLKSLLSRLQLERQAREAEVALRHGVDTLKAQLRLRVKPAPPPPPPLIIPDALAMAKDKTEDIVDGVEANPPLISESTPTGPTGEVAAVGAPQQSSVQVSMYDWQCRWLPEDRRLLVDLVDATRSWVAIENKHSSKLTQADKRARPADRCEPVDEKTAVTTLLAEIIAALPDRCQFADQIYVRKVVATERTRRRKLSGKEGQNQHQSDAPSLASADITIKSSTSIAPPSPSSKFTSKPKPQSPKKSDTAGDNKQPKAQPIKQAMLPLKKSAQSNLNHVAAQQVLAQSSSTKDTSAISSTVASTTASTVATKTVSGVTYNTDASMPIAVTSIATPPSPKTSGKEKAEKGPMRCVPVPDILIPELTKFLLEAGSTGITHVIERFVGIHPELAKRQVEKKILEIAVRERRGTDTRPVWHIRTPSERESDLNGVVLSPITTDQSSALSNQPVSATSVDAKLTDPHTVAHLTAQAQALQKKQKAPEAKPQSILSTSNSRTLVTLSSLSSNSATASSINTAVPQKLSVVNTIPMRVPPTSSSSSTSLSKLPQISITSNSSASKPIAASSSTAAASFRPIPGASATAITTPPKALLTIPRLISSIAANQPQLQPRNLSPRLSPTVAVVSEATVGNTTVTPLTSSVSAPNVRTESPSFSPPSTSFKAAGTVGISIHRTIAIMSSSTSTVSESTTKAAPMEPSTSL